MADLDMDKLRKFSEEEGYWPASTDDGHLAKLREDNRRFDEMNADDPQGTKWSKMGPSMGPR